MEVSDLHAEVPLPRSAEKLLDEICAKHTLPPADAELRRKLASAGEDRALQVLRTIADSTTKVRSLPGFATHLLRQSPSPPPQSSPSRSPAPENPRPSDSPGTLITNSPGPLITNSPGNYSMLLCFKMIFLIFFELSVVWFGNFWLILSSEKWRRSA